jgi:hypothetical protein
MDSLIELDRRISRAIAKGKGIRFSDEELDLLVTVGAIDTLKSAASEALKAQAEARHLAREQRQREASELLGSPTGRRRSSQPSVEDAAKASHRAQRTSRRRAPKSGS